MILDDYYFLSVSNMTKIKMILLSLNPTSDIRDLKKVLNYLYLGIFSSTYNQFPHKVLLSFLYLQSCLVIVIKISYIPQYLVQIEKSLDL